MRSAHRVPIETERRHSGMIHGARGQPVGSSRPLVAVVDDDVSASLWLLDVIREFGFSAQAFESTAELLRSGYVGEIGCLVADADTPGMSGLELLQEVKHRGYAIPIVFISSHRSEALRRRLVEEGATECLFKPLTSAVLLVLLDSIEVALQRVER
jgi:FixJ family two-component response regulator